MTKCELKEDRFDLKVAKKNYSGGWALVICCLLNEVVSKCDPLKEDSLKEETQLADSETMILFPILP